VASREAVAEELVGAEQVRDVGAREVPAQAAGTALLDRRAVVKVPGVVDVELPLGHPQRAVPRNARGEHRIEEIDPAVHRIEHVHG